MPNANRTFACLLCCSCFLLPATPALAQEASRQNTPEQQAGQKLSAIIEGRVTEAATGQPLAGADVFVQGTATLTRTDNQGYFKLPPLPYGKYAIAVFSEGLKSVSKAVEAHTPQVMVAFALQPLEETLKEIVIERKEEKGGIARLQAVEGTAIYEAKKSEVILIEGLTANLATNNSRQIYSKVPGLNIWESDGAGLQLGIGGRGLSPNRTANFNTRQNGYDISADALGYPESYYTPPTEGVEKIQIVRGAASLQYGTQFGGMLNFVMKKGVADKPFEFISRQTLGSFGLYNSFNSVGGTKGKINYYGFHQYKRGDGWRPNSGFEAQTMFADLNMQLTDKFFLCLEYTRMHYLAQQPGGLTDLEFERDPRQSTRDRNWFKVDWNLMAVLMEYRFNQRTRLEMKNFGLYASRDALGDLGRLDREVEKHRTFISDQFRNIGSELRLLHHYKVRRNPAVFLMGVRAYRGLTYKKQGVAAEGRGADFRYLKADSLASNHRFPNWNGAVFAENILNLSERLSITPGLRFEWISTRSEGTVQEKQVYWSDGELKETTVERQDVMERSRPVLLAGLGISYKLLNGSEFYANISQNYRSITFTDLRTINENIIVDPNLKDEKGYSSDLGWRGQSKGFNWDASLFYISYQDRIGAYLTSAALRGRSNIGDAYIAGIETFLEAEVLQYILHDKNWELRPFVNLSLIRGRYTASKTTAVIDKKLELVPEINLKSGLSLRKGPAALSWQFSYLSEQFTDATNAATPTAGSVIGKIPQFYVMDLSGSYEIGKYFKLEGGINNLTDNMYFTRRAEGYPGPGIIPSDARNFYLTLQFKY